MFLDADLLPEADWLMAHARWHHAAPDAVTLGRPVHVSVDGLDAEAIRERSGTLSELFAGRPLDLVDRRWWESYLRQTDELTSKADELFQVVLGGNLGVRRGFFELVGGFDESFTAWGGEDTEFGYRAHVRGGILVPMRKAVAWHQGPWEEGRAAKDRSRKLALAKLEHLIAHPWFRSGSPGRTFAVPQFVVTIRGGSLPTEELLNAVERVLAGRTHDLVVRLELPADHAGRAWLELQLGPDPRVRVGAALPGAPGVFGVSVPGDAARESGSASGGGARAASGRSGPRCSDGACFPTVPGRRSRGRGRSTARSARRGSRRTSARW